MGNEQTENFTTGDETDTVILWENDIQFKKVKRSEYTLLQYPAYRSIMIITS